MHMKLVVVQVVVTILIGLQQQQIELVEGVWCVARSDASDNALQSGLDYACAAGADCGPIQQTGLCFLPNTLQAHASYAFNSFYQRNHMSASSCDFSGAATLAKTDPSYGSCVYPASPSTAGSITTSPTTGGTSPRTNPYGTSSPFTQPKTFGGGAATGTDLNPNSMGPPIPTTNESAAAAYKSSSVIARLLWEILLILLLLLTVC